MPSEERRNEVLVFLKEHDIALPPLAIYAGLKREKNITFSYRTVQNSLSDLLEDGLVMRVDTTQLRKNSTIKPVDEESGRRSYYFITDDGRKRLNKKRDE